MSTAAISRRILILGGVASIVAVAATSCLGGARFEPVAAHVAVEVDGAAATDGRLEIAPGTAFRIHAVLEATNKNGETTYFTEATQLRLQGRDIDPASIRPWDGPDFAQVLWLTLEPPFRFGEIESTEEASRFTYDGFARPDWGRGWVAEAELDLRSAEALDGERIAVDFGTRFLQAWVELSPKRDAILPERRFKSPGSEAVMSDPSQVTTLVVREEGSLGAAQRFFGLAQVEVDEAVEAELRPALEERIDAWLNKGLAYRRIAVLRAAVDESGERFEDLQWNRVELGAAVRWGSSVRAGDVLRVGARWVILLEDQGGDEGDQGDGVLDGEDTCLDFERGASVLRISDVFVGEGEIEHASLAKNPGPE